MITKKALNKLTGHRTISIQEAAHEIAELELVLCSDVIKEVSLGKTLASLRSSKHLSDKYNANDLISSYRYRTEQYKHLSMEQYFYQEFQSKDFYTDKDTKRKKYRVLLPKGLNCRPCYPANYDYARGMLLLHIPWHDKENLDALLSDKDATVVRFLQMIGDRKFPLYVLAAYNRAVKYSLQYQYERLQKEATNKSSDIDLSCMTEEEIEQWEHSRHLSTNMTTSNACGGMRADIGLDHDWSKSFYTGQRHPNTSNGELYTEYLRGYFYKSATHHQSKSSSNSATPNKTKTGDDAKADESEPTLKSIHIPLQKDGTTEYKLEDLNAEQQAVVICAMDTIIKFLNNDPDYKPFRATVVGSGGTGKSFIINTLISIIRKYTMCNDSVKVAAPSGGAAYNVQGCTMHRCLSIAVDKKKLCQPLSPERQNDLANQLIHMLMLIVDERSMLNSKILAAAERNIRHCVYGQQNQDEKWGGIPVVLVFGDDYQLFPVAENGAIEGYSKKTQNSSVMRSYKEGTEQLLESQGHDIFIDDLAENVFTLTENYRTINDPLFGQILERLRVGMSTEADAERLMCQFLPNQDDDKRDTIMNDNKTVYLFTQNKLKDHKNQVKLADLSQRTGKPIARLRCQWLCKSTQNNGIKSVKRNHFKDCKGIILHADFCVGAPVSIDGMNIVPEAGLYNGARGWLVDIVYDTVEGPNNRMGNHLPLYMVVDFPGLRLNGAEPWDANNPTVSVKIPRSINGSPLALSWILCLETKHVPIPMQEVTCKDNCCSATYCPLVLSWAMTVHKFQGFEAGFSDDDMVKYIIADMNDLLWEKNHAGTAYTVTSRAKTIGTVTEDNPHPMESNLFFDGQVGTKRFTRVRFKDNGEVCLTVMKRDAWAQYLQHRSDVTKSKYTESVLSSLSDSNVSELCNPMTSSMTELGSRIMNIISDPNPTWKEIRKQYIIE